VFTRPGTPLARALRGTAVRVHELRCGGEWDVWAARRLAQAVDEAGVQLLAAHASHAHGLAVLARWFGLHPPLVVHRRVDFPIHGGPLNRRKYAAPTAFIAISDAVKNCLTAAGVDERKIAVVSSGVPPHRPVANARAVLAARFGLPPDAPWVGDIAGLVDHKGHTHLLDAWARVVGDGVRAALVLVGDGPRRASLEAQIARLGIGGSVRLVGWQDDVAAWLSAFDVFVMTSVTEGLCTAVLDAMAARVPVVATSAGGIPELVVHGQTGWLAPVGDAAAIAAHLREVLRDKELARARAEHAFTDVWQRRSADAMVAQTLAVYRRVPGESPAGT
jgi:glycosyltransferase involved in cell wall biosynthesis